MEAGNKDFHEVVHLLAAARFKRRFQSRFCQQEFIISRREFFQHFGVHLGAMRDVAGRFDDGELDTIVAFMDSLTESITTED